jgi:hypothetical protein
MMETEPAGIAASAPKRKSSCLLVAVIALLLIVILAVGGYLWYNRPIKPVELSAKESQALEQKIDRMEVDAGEPKYEAGTKEIIITERELNGLLNENTDLGGKLSFALATDEIHARLETDLDEDLPVLGGKKLKAKARLLVKTTEGRPSLILDDLTVWGVSLPNDWLGGMKGKDLLSEIFGDGGNLGGIKEIRIEHGQLVIRLAD